MTQETPVSSPTGDVQLRPDELAYRGDAVARLDGQVIFVTGGLPGEDALVRITEQHKSYSRGVVREVINASPDRVTPPCPYFGTCGGCQWQYIDPTAQTQQREYIVRRLFEQAKLGEVEFAPPLRSPQPFHYRATAQFAPGRDGLLGFKRARSHAVVPIDECLLLPQTLNDLIEPLNKLLPTAFPNKPLYGWLKQVTMRIDRNDQILILAQLNDRLLQEYKLLAMRLRQELPNVASVLMENRQGVQWASGRSYLIETVGDWRFRISAGAFFQVNRDLAEPMVRRAIELLDPQPDDRFIDAYSGVGLFAIAVAPLVREVIGIEEHLGAVEDAGVNATLNNVSNFTVLPGKTEAVLEALETEPGALLLVDPPRDGCHPRALARIVEMQPRRIVYVSCDPSTLARDLSILRDGGYRIRQSQVIDLFPQTYHIETITVLEG